MDKKPRLLKLLLQLLVVLLTTFSVCAWRKEEFRNCHQTPFCEQGRALEPCQSCYYLSDVVLVDGSVQAKLHPPPLNNGDSVNPLLLKVTVYYDGILRVKINELNDGSEVSRRKRFEVPYVVEPSLDDRKLSLQKIAQKEGASVIYLDSRTEVHLQHSPFEIYIRNEGGRLMSFNRKGLFQFEQLKVNKQEGEQWEENFRSHTDSRPHGPQSINFDVTFHNADHVYGIPEHATSLALKATRGPNIVSEPYRLFNLDVFEYIEESPFGLYGSIPFMLSHSSDRSNGFFWLNSAEMLIDVLAPGWDKGDSKTDNELGKMVETQWMAESGIVDAFFFMGPTPKDLMRQYTTVTGLASMPQFFATAYHQCRWNYKDESDVFHVNAGFDEHDIPYDVLWLDIEHTDGKRYLTFDKSLFPNPSEMQNMLIIKGRRMVTIVDPHIKRDDTYYIHREATLNGYYVKDVHGRDFDGWCWPGSSSYLDMLNPEVQKWWAGKISYSSYAGSTPSLYIWNDMNEPSVFNGPEATMPRDCLHYGGAEHRDVHNAYGYYFHMATAKGLFEREAGKDRPFVLSRSFFAGTQKIGPVWTGDNTARWDHLRVSMPMVLSLGITGLSFIGADVGGFFGNPDPELLTRWYQLGAFYPFFRAHAHLDSKRREPWLFGEPYTTLIREAIQLRYSLLPYFYTLFREASVSGVSVMRPLWMEFPKDEVTFTIDKACMIGNSLLVQGVFQEKETTVTIYLPGGEPWYDVRTGTAYPGSDYHQIPVTVEAIPVFQRGGTIIARKDRARRSSPQTVNDPYTLVVALNSSAQAEGELYIDDGQTYDFLEGAYIHRKFTFSQGKLTSSNIGPKMNRKTAFSSPCLVERIIFIGLSGATQVSLEPSNRRIELESGPMLLRPGLPSNAYIIRKPYVPIAEDWSIKLL